MRKRTPRTPSWGENPWKPNDPGRCPGQVREKAQRGAQWARPARKGRCILPLGHPGGCSLVDDGR